MRLRSGEQLGPSSFPVSSSDTTETEDEIVTEDKDCTTEEDDVLISPPPRKKIKRHSRPNKTVHNTHLRPSKKAEAFATKGPLATLLDNVVKQHESAETKVRNDEAEHRMNVVVREIKNEGFFQTLRVGVLNEERNVEKIILINLQSLDKTLHVSVGQSLTICAPWQEIQLSSSLKGYICPFVKLRTA